MGRNDDSQRRGGPAAGRCRSRGGGARAGGHPRAAPGRSAGCRVGRDLRLRDESWDFAITSDFVDIAAYQAYDREAEHNRVRREMFGPLCAKIVRVQFEA